jgi:hypothetical protein
MDTDETDFDVLFAKVPANFPRPVHAGAVSGFSSKLLLVQYKGKLYEPGCAQPEIASPWDMCEDLAFKMKGKSLESTTGKCVHMSQSDILATPDCNALNVGDRMSSNALSYQTVKWCRTGSTKFRCPPCARPFSMFSTFCSKFK